VTSREINESENKNVFARSSQKGGRMTPDVEDARECGGKFGSASSR
jgi:hypothetical protein